MKPAPVDQRIEGALQLQPMTVEMLAKCLSLDTATVRKHARALRYQRRISARQHLPTPNGRPWIVYSARGFCQSQKAASPATRASRGGV